MLYALNEAGSKIVHYIYIYICFPCVLLESPVYELHVLFRVVHYIYIYSQCSVKITGV
jgi:hypothetical protein